jgi:hypothetical protein
VDSRFCRKCHRLLTNPVSVEAGIGPVCKLREREHDDKQGVFDFDAHEEERMNERFTEDIICSRNENGIKTQSRR